jgi:hypothetical protein
MAMFGTSQGSFQPAKERSPIMPAMPTGSAPGAGEVKKPEATKKISPSSVKIK